LVLSGTPILLKDIVTGFSGSTPESVTAVGSTLYFAAVDSTAGIELWKTDGTEAGTVRVKDIRTGNNGSIPQDLTAVGSTLYFTADNGTSGRALWKTDGTEAGTVRVKDIQAFRSSPSDFTAVGSTLYFTADDGAAGRELWKSDGTEAGTVRVKDIRAGSAGSDPRYLTAVGSTLYFTADDGTSGPELWKTNGTDADTVRVKDIRAGVSGSSPPQFLTAVGSILYFRASDGISGNELWKTDGTEEGTVRVKDIIPGIGSSEPFCLTAVGSTLYFSAQDVTAGHELWKTDGTAAGTVRVKDIWAGWRGSNLSNLTAVGSMLYFLADDGLSGPELWKTDGTDSGTIRVKDIRAGRNGSIPRDLTTVGSSLYFTANNGTTGRELWETDGTQGGTFLIDIRPGILGSEPEYLTAIGSTLYFSANDGPSGRELWVLRDAGENNAPTISMAVSPASVTEDGTTNLVYTFTRTGPTTSALTVNYTVGGTATLGTDYTGISATGTTKTITFAAGSATATLTVDPTADTTAESDETVILTLASGTGYTIGTTTPVTGTITNVALPPIVTVAATSADKAEGTGSAPTPFTFTVTRTGVLTGASSVAWAAAGSGASPATAADFVNGLLPSGTVAFSAGETTKTITVNVVADALAEADEGFTVALSSPSGATLGVPAQASGTIRSPAPPKPPQPPILRPAVVQSAPRVTIAGPAEPVSRGAEVPFVVEISSPAGTGKSITVNYSTLDGSARAGKQYEAVRGSLVFTGQETSKTILVPTMLDSVAKPFKPDRFSIRLTAASGAKIVASTAIATIAPIPPGLAISNITVEEGNAGTKQARFVVTLGTPSDLPVTVDYATADGSAYSSDGDYTAIPRTTLTFAPGGLPYKIVTVNVAGDTAAENNEVFFVNLSNASGAAITKATGTATIRNDDTAPKTTSEFQITVDYATSVYGAVPANIRAICEKVAKRWSEVIVGDLPSVTDPALGFTDDFRMTVTMGLLGTASGTDGSNQALANAKPLEFRKDGAKLPWLGITGIDPADTDPQDLEATLLHEFGHALGLVPEVWDSKNLVLSLTDGPLYVGINAVREFNTIYGESVRGIPLEKEGGAGTKAAHWSEPLMKAEIMTGFIEPPGTRMPLSKITVGALADIGYTVDYARADPFTRPANVTVPSYAFGGLPNGGAGGGGPAPLRRPQPAALFAAAGLLPQAGSASVKPAVFASYRYRSAAAG
jgi:ELWxxDGT repeat protein